MTAIALVFMFTAFVRYWNYNQSDARTVNGCYLTSRVRKVILLRNNFAIKKTRNYRYRFRPRRYA